MSSIIKPQANVYEREERLRSLSPFELDASFKTSKRLLALIVKIRRAVAEFAALQPVTQWSASFDKRVQFTAFRGWSLLATPPCKILPQFLRSNALPLHFAVSSRSGKNIRCESGVERDLGKPCYPISHKVEQSLCFPFADLANMFKAKKKSRHTVTRNGAKLVSCAFMRQEFLFFVLAEFCPGSKCCWLGQSSCTRLGCRRTTC